MRNFAPASGTLNLISIDPPLKSGNSDLQKYPENLCPIEIDIHVFVHLKKLILFKTETMEKLSEINTI